MTNPTHDPDFVRDELQAAEMSAADHERDQLSELLAAADQELAEIYDANEGSGPNPTRYTAARIHDWVRQRDRRRDAEVAAKALEDARDEMRRMMDGFPQRGRHTRAGWAVGWLDHIIVRIRREAGGAS